MQWHPTESNLRALFSGLCLADEVEEMVAHVTQCRECWRQAASLVNVLRGEHHFSPSPLASNLAKTISAEERHALRLGRARAGVDLLKSLSPSDQSKAVQTNAYMRSWLFFKTVLREVPVLLRQDPLAAQGLANLAREIARALPKTRYPDALRRELEGEALAHEGNTLRCAADFSSAKEVFDAADPLLADRSSIRRAFFELNRSALLADLGHYELALEGGRRAQETYARERDAWGISTVGLLVAGVNLASRRFAACITEAERVLALDKLNPRHKLMAQGMVVDATASLGNLTEARLRFSEVQPLFADFPDTLAHEAYLDAVILSAAGQFHASERRMREAVRRFLDIESYKDANLTLFRLLEDLVRRDAIPAALELCSEVLKGSWLEEKATICEAWRALQTELRSRSLDKRKLTAFHQFFQRCWAVSTPWRRFQTPVAEPTPAAPEPPALEPYEPLSDENLQAEGFTAEQYKAQLAQVERDLFCRLVQSNGYSVRATARALGKSRNTIASKFNQYGLPSRSAMTTLSGDD